MALSIVIAVFASYAALDLGSAHPPARFRSALAWAAAAAFAMGGGIWAMHFVGMLAFEMGMPARYDLGTTVLSLLIAVGSTAAAFAWVAREGIATAPLLVAGSAMGWAWRPCTIPHGRDAGPGNLAYDPRIVAASVAIAVTASTAALWLTFRRNRPWQRLMAAGVMGLAVAGMHYTGMAAATFTAEEAGAHPAHAAVLSTGQQDLALAVAVSPSSSCSWR